MKKVILSLGLVLSLFLTSCDTGYTGEYRNTLSNKHVLDLREDGIAYIYVKGYEGLQDEFGYWKEYGNGFKLYGFKNSNKNEVYSELQRLPGRFCNSSLTWCYVK